MNLIGTATDELGGDQRSRPRPVAGDPLTLHYYGAWRVSCTDEPYQRFRFRIRVRRAAISRDKMTGLSAGARVRGLTGAPEAVTRPGAPASRGRTCRRSRPGGGSPGGRGGAELQHQPVPGPGREDLEQVLAVDGDVVRALVAVLAHTHRAVRRHREHADVGGLPVLLPRFAGADGPGLQRRTQGRDLDEDAASSGRRTRRR